MQLIDRYELTLPGHMRLVDARSALNYLERFIQSIDGPVDSELLEEKMEPLVEALNDAADDARPVSGDEAFQLKACQWGYIALSPKERSMVHLIRCCNEEGKEDIMRLITETQRCKPQPEPR
ncbi:hypothetical protein [Pseudomonas sp. LP_7_YM]|uniref:hypothetical protein n=1 Tax=Pseudomonas sp. LP_7_YM TaxID=2485137 RepID=UPI00105B296D|nr:hypothetical protein [Pseudomonas sp. LP_7_YM]TDV70128.1 hypothetical protein EC915_102393 [Pseudomonas sp. LP_7_YM]